MVSLSNHESITFSCSLGRSVTRPFSCLPSLLCTRAVRSGGNLSYPSNRKGGAFMQPAPPPPEGKPVDRKRLQTLARVWIARVRGQLDLRLSRQPQFKDVKDASAKWLLAVLLGARKQNMSPELILGADEILQP